ncbi:MAG TPA: FAD-binding protein [Planctomycetota bacterium]|nr:FAD-binding protein [Planctomycetota bacterium]
MPIRVSNVATPAGGDERGAAEAALRRAGVGPDEVLSVDVVRRSLDRRGGRPTARLTVEIRLRDESAPTRSTSDPDVRRVAPEAPRTVPRGDAPLDAPPVVIGAGPAGLFAALTLARAGFRPVVLERGDAMNARATKIRDLNRDGVLDPESNYLFGEGGAGTWSDGKLTSRSKDPRAREVLDEFRTKSGVDAVTVFYRPHLGSDRIRAVVGRLRQEILALGGVIRFRTRVEGLRIVDGAVRGVILADGALAAEEVVLAPGHSARAFVRRLYADGVPMVRKPFQTGFRVEHPQPWIDRAVWGDPTLAGKLGPADYRLSARGAGLSLFSFCMCPGGEIIPAMSDLEHVNTNGMSYSKKDSGFANSGLVATLEPDAFGGAPDDPLAGIALQERYEAAAAEATGGSLRVPAQRLSDFLEGRVSDALPPGSCRTGFTPADLSCFAPETVVRGLKEASRAFARQLKGFLHPSALLVGPESRSSSPVRFLRDPESLESPGVAGLRPVGEGAGFAGGIVSAAVDGVRAAEAILARRRPGSSFA